MMHIATGQGIRLDDEHDSLQWLCCDASVLPGQWAAVMSTILQPNAILAATCPGVGKGNKDRRLRVISFCSDDLGLEGQTGPGLRVNSGCDSTRPSVLEGGRPGLLCWSKASTNGPQARAARPALPCSPTISLGPRWKAMSIRSPLFQARDGKTTQPAESVLYFTPAA